LQTATEETVVHVARALSAEHPLRNLCLTGGVALNCVANARITRDTDYTRVWVPPCPSDSGAPLGGALWHHQQTLGQPRRHQLTHPFYATAYDGVAVVLNTSFNRHEPIVASPDEVVSCYQRTGMDALAIGDFWVTA
jgi:predicted NodU family carbamoyl transferase